MLADVDRDRCRARDDHQTVAERVGTARKLYAGAGRRAPGPASGSVGRAAPPAEEWEWLTAVEAAEFAGCGPYTVRNCRRGGLLPNTQHPSPKVYLYRADLQRVMRAPRYNHGVSYRTLRAEIAASPV
jgi:hypothetical protein